MSAHGKDPGKPTRRGVQVLTCLVVVLSVLGPFANRAWITHAQGQDVLYAPPGTLLQAGPITQGVPDGARAWRILYSTTRDVSVPTVSSATVLASATAPEGARPIIAWDHGTVGVAEACAPSLSGAPFASIPAVDQVLAQGWIVVATDYVGLGTPGPHPYLIGQGEARSTLDSIRAARQLGEIDLDNRVVVWGHSQGGHAALWSGEIATSYALDLDVIGIAAIAPASDLPPLIEALPLLPGGNLLQAYVATAYSQIYDDVSFEAIVKPDVRENVRSWSSQCGLGPGMLDQLLQAGSIFTDERSALQPLAERLHENVPFGPITAPVLIAQGLDDALVLPDIQREYVDRRCQAGQIVEQRTYAGLDHLSVIAPGSLLESYLVQWTQERLGNQPSPANCVTIPS